MVILTNRISNSVITKEIKENFPVRMGFRMLDKRGSIVTLDTPGAEWLNGKGDMLLLRESDVKRELSTFLFSALFRDFSENRPYSCVRG